MNEYFENEILRIEREILWLKTCAIQSSATVETVKKNTTVNVPLSMNAPQTSCRGSVSYVVTPDTNAIVMATLDWYHQDVTKEWEIARTSRLIDIDETVLSNGKIKLTISAIGTNYSTDGTDDLSKLKNGQSVSISAVLTVRATDNFTLEVYNG